MGVDERLRFYTWILAAVLCPFSASFAATLELVDPFGATYNYSLRINGGLFDFADEGITFEPAMGKFESLVGVTAYEASWTPIEVMVGGWGLAPTALNRRAESLTTLRVRIAPGQGESNGDAITVYVHSKAHIVDGFNARVRHQVLLLNRSAPDPLPLTNYNSNGWFVPSIPYDAIVGDEFEILSDVFAATNGGGNLSSGDSRLCLSFSSTPCPDPPIVVLPGASVPFLSSHGVVALCLSCAGAGIAALKGRRWQKVSQS